MLARNRAEREGAVAQDEALKPPRHLVNVLSVRKLGPGEPVEAGEVSELQDCPGSDFDLVEVEADPTPGGPVRGACFVCGKGFIQKGQGDPVEPIDGSIEIIAASALAAKIAP